MNALPIIMTFLAAKEYNKNKQGNDKYIIPQLFEFISLKEENTEKKKKEEEEV